jgi:hypothetical protein
VRQLRQSLTDSYIAAVAILFLLLWSIVPALELIWKPLFGVIDYVATAIAIRGIPSGGAFYPRLLLVYFLDVFAYIVTAWLLSLVVYKGSPIRSLRIAHATLKGKQNV